MSTRYVKAKPKPKTVYDLTWKDCRWIGDTPGIYECTEPIFQRSYCEAHYRRCYVVSASRVRLPHPLPVDPDGYPKAVENSHYTKAVTKPNIMEE